ncbi:hypothetical protein [Nocardia spumae]|uniref:hypothetical protein n=1 Tax=Nocardia spumae TaxID=2887190 RepID=UPI001D15ACEB|nr:hypothetical protein [Nocardia spumae]
MHSEHEQAMRADFVRYTALEPSTDSELDLNIELERTEIDRHWQRGPHAEHWRDLSGLDRQYRHAPQDMLRERDLLRATDPTYPATVYERSLEQATDLAFDRIPHMRRISAGYTEIDGQVVHDGTRNSLEYPESRFSSNPFELDL